MWRGGAQGADSAAMGQTGIHRDRVRDSPSKISQTLARNAVFGVLSPAVRRAVEENGRSVQLSMDTHLFRRGDPSDAAYAIISG